MNEIILESVDYAFSHGLVISKTFNEKNSPTSVIHAPFSLLPSPFPKKLFELAMELAPKFNIRAHNVASDEEFLKETLTESAKSDEFVSKLLYLLEQSKKDPSHQKIVFAILRSDYMLHQVSDSYKLQQVELNHISCSFSSLSSVVSEMHHFVVKKLELSEYDLNRMPQNDSDRDIPEAISKAWELYGDKNAVVVFVTQINERNRSDQRKIEFNLTSKYGIRVLRRTLSQIHQNSKLVGDKNELVVDGYTVAVCYFRAGYTPNDYPTETEWKARELIEKSFAIKCPTISYQLGGLKKIQQKISETSVLEKFVGDEVAKDLRQTFADLYSLSEETGHENVIKMAVENREDYVLKPQREGGGNNFYGDEMVETLKNSNSEELKAYILMGLIKPRPFTSFLLKESQYNQSPSTSELGIYSVYLHDGKQELLNKSAGFLFRTKMSHVKESGIAAGFGALDSVYLIDTI
eukprot:TRINITY_DN1245_c0_g1_i3.p1 TRINITY_DN1245_c0_g1~~TRINITY_DN1245_c0_g1_i3.p1  ORF type:complete len:529 (-),score=133.51 TRINITY_DN1245_c0_g1_i3:59-1450(-)